jgi:UDP-N-acetylmuramate--alanine ligase
VTGELVAAAVPGGGARFVPTMDGALALITAMAEPGDVIVTMGAGDVTKLGPRIVEALGGNP